LKEGRRFVWSIVQDLYSPFQPAEDAETLKRETPKRETLNESQARDERVPSARDRPLALF
jgi:hypothetical protein